MKNKPKIIVITGAESTGKSDLTVKLANHFNVPYLPEFARTYIEGLNRKYNYNDVETIARKQVAQLREYINSAHSYIFVDTWLIITKVWFEAVFKRLPEWLESEIKNTPVEMFLVCATDLPWVPDKVRENGGEQREILQRRYLEILENYGFHYKIVKGLKDDRLKNALNYLQETD